PRPALEAFAKENPAFAPALKMREGNPGIRMAANQLLGNVMLVIALPSQGLPLETVGQSLTAQFAVVPGVSKRPKAEPVTVAAGDALHWTINLTANKVGCGKISVVESVYLLVKE